MAPVLAALRIERFRRFVGQPHGSPPRVRLWSRKCSIVGSSAHARLAYSVSAWDHRSVSEAAANARRHRYSANGFSQTSGAAYLRLFNFGLRALRVLFAGVSDVCVVGRGDGLAARADR